MWEERKYKEKRKEGALSQGGSQREALGEKEGEGKGVESRGGKKGEEMERKNRKVTDEGEKAREKGGERKGEGGETDGEVGGLKESKKVRDGEKIKKNKEREIDGGTIEARGEKKRKDCA